MSNNKQSMKLYTEEQLKDMLSGYIGKKYTDDYLSRYYVPIEIPSDEEIEEKCNSLDGYEFDSHESAFFGGAKWMRDKIGGNK